MHVVLVEPEIPYNTGNIARTCAATGTSLHLVRPLGFSVEDRYLKRAGLDYWHLVDIHYHDSFEEVRQKYGGHSFFFRDDQGAAPLHRIQISPRQLFGFWQGDQRVARGAAESQCRVLPAHPYAVGCPLLEFSQLGGGDSL